MHYRPGDRSYTIWAKADAADWWNAARRIPGAPPPPPMPEINDDPQTGLAAADVMLRWLAALDAPPAMIYLTEEDFAILAALADAHPRLLTQGQIEKALKLKVSARTIQSRLQILLGKNLVCRPEGQRSGWGITHLGRNSISRAK